MKNTNWTDVFQDVAILSLLVAVAMLAVAIRCLAKTMRRATDDDMISQLTDDLIFEMRRADDLRKQRDRLTRDLRESLNTNDKEQCHEEHQEDPAGGQ